MFPVSDIIQNKYHRWYVSLMNKRISVDVPKDVYSEGHHMYPKYMGGPDVSENIVRLTAREHFVAHRLLPKFMRSKKHFHAANCAVLNFANRGQKRGNNQKHEYEKLNSRAFEKVRQAFAASQSAKMKGNYKRNPPVWLWTDEKKELARINVAKICQIGAKATKTPQALAKAKKTWKETGRNTGEKNPMANPESVKKMLESRARNKLLKQQKIPE